MLKSNLERMYNEAVENKNLMEETIKTMYEPVIEEHESNLVEINKELSMVYVCDEDCENKIDVEGKIKITKEELNNLLENKKSAENILANTRKEYEKDMKQLSEVEEELNIQKPEDTSCNLSTVHDAIEVLKKKLDEEGTDKDRVLLLIEMLSDTITLNRLKAFNPTKSKANLRKTYKELNKLAQRRISMDKNYIFPSLNPIKKVIKEIISFNNRSLTEKEVMKDTKLILAYIYSYIIKMNMVEEGLFLYYLLDNLMSMENLPISDQTTFRESIISLL